MEHQHAPTVPKLTWVEKLKQWRKRRNIGGKTKTFYLGTGHGRDDEASYQRALAKWQAIEKTFGDTERLQFDCELWNGETTATESDMRPGWDARGKTLASCVDEYLADQQHRYEHGLKLPDAPQND